MKRAPVLACAAVLGCGSPAPPVRPPLAPAVVAETPVAAAAPFEWPAALAEPVNPACTLRAEAFPTEFFEDPAKSNRSLRFTPESVPFAYVYRGKDVELALPAGDARAGGMLSLDADGVSVRGILVAEEMPLYPAAPFVVSGVFVPDSERRLEWRSTKPGSVTVAVAALPKVSVVDGELAAERRCDDVSLGPVAFDMASVDRAIGPGVHRAEWPAQPWQGLRQGKIPLAATAGGPAVVEIDSVEPPDDTLLVHPAYVLSVTKGQTRIALATYGGTLFGWVPTARLWTSSRQYVDLQHDCDSVVVLPQREADAFVACDHDVPLVAQAMGGDRRIVGTVRAGTAFEPLHEKGAWTEVAFRDAGIAAAGQASFLLRSVDIAGCTKR